MAEIVILGAGAMGSAFAVAAADAGNTVHLVGTHLDAERIRAAKATRIHPRISVMLPDTVLPTYNEELESVLTPAVRLVVLGVSSAGVRWAIDRLGPCLRAPLPVLMLTKGLAAEAGGIRILPAVVAEGLGAALGARVPVGAVGGPCIAGELAARRHSSVALAGPDEAYLSNVTRLLRTPYYHIHPSTDLVGVEACAAFKNFYALAVGSASGAFRASVPAENGAKMINPEAALFAQSVKELQRIVRYLGGGSDAVYGLPGVGDLYVTCRAGRNSRMGALLGEGYRFRDAKASHMPEDTIEGADLAAAVGETLEAATMRGAPVMNELPLAGAIIAAVCRNEPLAIPWDELGTQAGA